MNFKNLTILGTSHIAKQSITEIRKAIDELEPGIVAVELDKARLHSLLNENQKTKTNYRSVFQVGLMGFIFALLGKWMADKLGKAVGIKPGADMKEAVVYASSKKIPVALVDQDIRITLKKINKAIGWKERWSFLVDAYRGIVFKKKVMKEYGLDQFDLTKVPGDELVIKILNRVKIRYPRLYHVLLTERNIVMGNRLIAIMKKHPDKKIISVVGAGHKEGMIEYIKKTWEKVEIKTDSKAL